MGGQRLRGAPHGPGAAATCRYPPGRAGQGRAGQGSAPPAPVPPVPNPSPEGCGRRRRADKELPPGRAAGAVPRRAARPLSAFFILFFFIFHVYRFILFIGLFIYLFFRGAGRAGVPRSGSNSCKRRELAAGRREEEVLREAVPGELSLSSPRRPKTRPKSHHPAPNRLIAPQIAAARPAPSPRGDTRGRNNARGLVPVIPGAAHFVSLAAEAQLCQDSWGSSRKRFRYPRSACLATPLDLCSLLVPAADTRDDHRGIKY